MKNGQSDGFDIIGDIHGYASKLKTMLTKLGYTEYGGNYRHPERRAVFVGDFIDRGPEIMETLRIVRSMVDSGRALAVMGNHEYNAICYHTPDGKGGFLRPHTEKNLKPHRATLEQIAEPHPEVWADYRKWFLTLPLFLDLGGFRVVHACWDDNSIRALYGADRLSPEMLRRSVQRDTPEFEAVEVLLKGREIPLPEGAFFTDKEDTVRTVVRVKWWMDPSGMTYHELSLPRSDTVPAVPVPAEVLQGLGKGYGSAENPVFVGHYWLTPGVPRALAKNVACLDYSVAKNGPLVAFRWDGEAALADSKFIAI